MQRDDPRERSWRGRDDDLELWGRDMDQDDWIRGSYGPGGMPSRFGRRAWGSEWNRRPGWDRGSEWHQAPNGQQPQAWPSSPSGHFGPEPWRGDRDWSQEWWHRNAGFGWTGNPFETRGRQWHGRTPARGYQRSDERIREEVYEKLMEHPYMDTTDLSVSVSRGEVTLEGSVPDRWEKRLAEDLTEGVFGVTEVHNRLRAGATAQPLPESGGTPSASAPASSYAGSAYPSTWTSGAPAPRPMPSGSSPWPASSSARLAQLREGMQVVGLDGEQIGRVKEVRGDEFLIERGMGRNVFAPSRYLQNTQDDQIVLSIPARQVDSMGWRSPELMGTPPSGGA